MQVQTLVLDTAQYGAAPGIVPGQNAPFPHVAGSLWASSYIMPV